MKQDDDEAPRARDERYRGPEHSSPYPVSRLAPAFTLVDVAKEIEHADQLVGAVTANKLKVIVDQIRSLQEQAESILESARRDVHLHHARCAFKRLPGQTYHLYRRSEKETYFSMLSPKDWRGKAPHEFIGSYRLEVDMSWTPVDEIDKRDEEDAVVQKLLGG